MHNAVLRLPAPAHLPAAGSSPVLAPRDAGELLTVRCRINRDALAHHGVSHPRVVLYALTRPHGDPSNGLARAQGLATAMGCTVHARISDNLGDSPPRLRPGWGRVRTALEDPGSGVHGVIAVSRTAISNHRLYEDELAWLDAHHAGLWLVQAETDL